MSQQKYHREGGTNLNFLFHGCTEDPNLIMERIRNPPRGKVNQKTTPEGMIKSEMKPVVDFQPNEIVVRTSS
jgi:hypothetical protein